MADRTDPATTTVENSYKKLSVEMAKVISGQTEVIETMMIAFLAGGHLLLEGVPGTAKTLMVKTLSRLLDLSFKRVQFTPDLMPSDIVGNNIFDLATSSFELRKGPVFTDFLLADELNRTPPKTQAALLECMEERQVTIDGVRYPLGDCFMVFATQNPIEYEGTYPLPEAQLDRFMAKVFIDYPPAGSEIEIMRRYHRGFDPNRLNDDVNPIITAEELITLKEIVRRVEVEEKLFNYIDSITRATREDINLMLGAGPRASINLLLAAKARAAVKGRDFCIPDDVKALAAPVLRHRLILKPEAELDGLTADDIILGIMENIEVPR